MQRQNSKDDFDFRASVNLFTLLSYSYASCFTPFLRWGFGQEALGISGIGALLIILCTGAFAHEPRMVEYAGVWLVAVVIQRAKTWSDLYSGRSVHSWYSGYPWLCYLSFRQVWLVKWIVEPGACYLVGVLLLDASPVLYSFLAFGAGALLAVQVIEWRIDHVRLQQMRDAEIEQRYLAGMYRNHNR